MPLSLLSPDQRAVIERLAAAAVADPLPVEDTSSHWRLYGQRIDVRRLKEELRVSAGDLASLQPPGRFGWMLNAVERWTYRRITRQLRHYRDVMREATRLARQLGGTPNYNVMVAACALSTLMEHRPTLGPGATMMVIGDGAGFLGALSRRVLRPQVLLSVDLPSVLVLQALTHVNSDDGVRIADTITEPIGADVLLLPPRDLATFTSAIDVAVNISSMQEMTYDSIERYFRFLRARSAPGSLFYCVNRERKKLPGGEVIVFDGYPWSPADTVLVDGRCPYLTHFLSPTGSRQGPEFLGMRIPLVNGFDGPIRHRLVHLAPAIA